MITTLDYIIKKRKLIKNLVFTNGCFDLFHRGHLEIIKECIRHKNDKALSDYSYPFYYDKLDGKLVIAINTDESVKKLKENNRPIISYDDRAEIINNIKGVDYVIPIEDESVFSIIESIRPDIIIKGNTTEKIIGEDFVKSYGGKVIKTENKIMFSNNKILSTTNIINKIKLSIG